MGYWHTGYIEFHEPVGLDGFKPAPSPPRFPCAHCGATFPSSDELRNHRFETHPLHRPILFLKGRELGANSFRITEKLKADEVAVSGCDQAAVNGESIPLGMLPRRLARIASDVCRLTLSGEGVSSEFTLDFRIASQEHLKGIERQFESTAHARRLDTRAVEDFISATSQYHSAIGYREGICTYLYGVLAKERAPNSSLPYEAYVGKFTKAAEELALYDRPLARTIGSLIEFHFNHFADAARLAGEARVGLVAGRYAAWLQGRTVAIERRTVSIGPLDKLEALVTDWETERIVRWASQGLSDLARHGVEIESLLNRDIAEYDRVKLHILLGEIYAAASERENALRHARTLRNLSAFEAWAEAMIVAKQGGQ